VNIAIAIFKSVHNVILSEAKNLRSEMFESLASCFAFRCSASLNMTMR
jgi:hypothetical protein